MGYLAIGCLSFLLFILYDWNQTEKNFPLLKPLFAIGCLMLAGATVGLWTSDSFGRMSIPYYIQGLFWILAFTSGLLLIYTLFFAIPFQQAYVEGSRQELMTEGVYALCRHPGVWFFFFLYLFAGAAGQRPMIILAGFVFTLMNIGYVFLQDRYFFPKCFPGYPEYQQKTGFILPTKSSIHQSIRYYQRQR